MDRKRKISVPLSIVISKEGKWFVAKVPILDLATQGKTLKEVKENIIDLLNLYFENPHTPKPDLKNLVSDVMLTTVTVNIPKGASRNAKAHAVATT